jgi:mannose-1-phosphate guanylyltransferase/mannose-6-phosphate isomerase
MLAEGGYHWNSGMFLYRADRILEELATHEPDILSATEQAFDAATQAEDGGVDLPLDLYEKIPSAPIDKAVMERAARIAVVPCNPDWTDLGSWHSIWEQSEKDERGNAAYGDALLNNAENCLVHASSRLVACAGVRDLAIIETEDAILVVDRERSEPVKEVVASLNAADRPEPIRHRTADLAWGRASILNEGSSPLVRRLEIDPGKSVDDPEGQPADLHWLVVEGTARLSIGGQSSSLSAGASTDVPAATPFALANPTDVPLIIIEIGRQRRRA